MRLAPTITPDTAFFWEALRERRLLIQRCAECDAFRHPPRPMCPLCNSLEWDVVESAGHGSVFSFVFPRHPDFGFPEPHIVALVELDEGTRLVTNLVDIDPSEVTIGQRVSVRFEAFDGDLVLPLFGPEVS